MKALAVTSDGWTSIATQNYVTMTAHFIDEEWCMKSLCLQTRHVPESNTGLVLKERHKDAFREWKIDEKTITRVVDNARNVVCAWKLMEIGKPLCPVFWTYNESECEERFDSGKH